MFYLIIFFCTFTNCIAGSVLKKWFRLQFLFLLFCFQLFILLPLYRLGFNFIGAFFVFITPYFLSSSSPHSLPTYYYMILLVMFCVHQVCISVLCTLSCKDLSLLMTTVPFYISTTAFSRPRVPNAHPGWSRTFVQISSQILTHLQFLGRSVFHVCCFHGILRACFRPWGRRHLHDVAQYLVQPGRELAQYRGIVAGWATELETVHDGYSQYLRPPGPGQGKGII